MHQILALKGLRKFIVLNNPAGAAKLEVWNDQDIKEQAVIGLKFSDKFLGNVREIDSAKEILSEIKNVFDRRTLFENYLIDTNIIVLL